MRHSRFFRGVAALLILALLPSPARATGQVYFTVVNITFMELSSDTMPVWIDGTLYAPYNIFDDNTNGVASWAALGMYGSHSTSKQTVTLYSLRGTMIFDLERNVCYDQLSGRTYPSPAVTRNGLPFVPVGQVCSYFDLTYSYLTIQQGILLRIKSSSNPLSDEEFIDTAQQDLNRRLREYNQSLSYVPPSTDPVTPPEDNSPGSIPLYLGVRCRGEGGTAALADTLDAQGVWGFFFFSPEQLREQDDLVRRLVATGHGVGLLLTGDTPEESREQLELGERLLRELACVRPGALLCPEGQREDFEEAGWTCWRETASAQPDASLQEQARALRSQELVRLTLDDSVAMAEVANALIYQLKNRQFDIRIPMETRL